MAFSRNRLLMNLHGTNRRPGCRDAAAASASLCRSAPIRFSSFLNNYLSNLEPTCQWAPWTMLGLPFCTNGSTFSCPSRPFLCLIQGGALEPYPEDGLTIGFELALFLWRELMCNRPMKLLLFIPMTLAIAWPARRSLRRCAEHATPQAAEASDTAAKAETEPCHHV